MEQVRPAVLLSLWYIDSDNKSADRLLADYPQSPEAAIVSGRAGLLPAPFWFFSPRRDSSVDESGEESAPVPPVNPNSTVHPTMRQQVGLFRNVDNAKQLIAELAKKGFTANIKQETRANGTTNYIVLVPEDMAETMDTQLKNDGFDCYPIYE